MTDPALTIEPARAAEFPAVRALAELVWHEHYRGLISSEQIDYMLARGYSLPALTAFVAEAGAGLLLAKSGASLVGFAGYYATDDMTEMKLDKLYVATSVQRKGVGGALIARVATIAVAAGFRTLVLNVNKQNRQAITAYEKHGFRIRESTVNDIGHGFVMDDFVMARPLDAFPGEPPDAIEGRL